MPAVYLLLGTNLGDRRANLAAAMHALEGQFGKPEAVSKIVETEAVGFDGPAFLNCVARYRTRRRPHTILKVCKAIEHDMGRREKMEFRPDGTRIYHDRVIDIDILLYCPVRSASAAPGGSIVLDTPKLTIPHPQVESRAFVRPLLEEVL